MRGYRFTLYVAGESPRSVTAVANLRRFTSERLGGEVELAVVDVLVDPARAESDRILTTPTLVKEAPGLARRVTGDLGDPDAVMNALGLTTDPALP